MGQGKFEKKPEKKHTNSTGKAKSAGKKSKNNTNKILLRIMIGVLAVLLVLMVAAAAIMNYVFGKINRYDDQPQDNTEPVVEEFETDATEEGATYETVDPDSIIWQQVEQLQTDNKIINILLIGQDARPGETRARSDSMILVTLNTKTNSIQLTSFMRDLYVQIPGYQDNRINAAFAMGGPELLDQTLNVNFGVQVDGNVEVNFEAFQEVIDLLGGVDVELNSEEAGYMNRHGVSASAGSNHFDGDEALVFARMRKISDADYGRTDRQRRVITAMMNSLKGAGVGDILTLIDKVLPYVTTDLSNSEIISYASAGLSALAKGGEIGSNRIPADDAHYNAFVRGMDVLVPDLQMCQEDLKGFIYGEE